MRRAGGHRDRRGGRVDDRERRGGAAPGHASGGGEVDEARRHVGPPVEHAAPLADLVRLRGEVEDLPTLRSEREDRIHDRVCAVVVAVAERLVEEQRQAHARLLPFDERDADRHEELHPSPARQLVERVADARRLVEGAERGRVAVVEVQAVAAVRDACEQLARAAEDFRPVVVARGALDEGGQRVPDDGEQVPLAGFAQRVPAALDRGECGLDIVALLGPVQERADPPHLVLQRLQPGRFALGRRELVP